MVHEGDKYFEHCYAADFTPRVRPEDREACWHAWVAHYTRHQPAHRVDYAMLRIEALQAGEPTPSVPGLLDGPLTKGQVRSELADVDAAANNTGSSLLGPMMDLDAGPVPNGCLAFCSEYESRCATRCPPSSSACRAGCEHERAICLQGCH
jgi:hypothetical protein